MHRLRLAVVGLGEAGRAHAERLRDHDDCVLAAVCDPVPGAIERVAGYGVPRFHRLAELLDALRPDGVILAMPAASQVEAAL
ncbi:Gfo/Idh/MocA family oxidoreductase [Propionivibrio dicarboxylicus]|uniref:Oxidoreductase family, NAD-binding Rossmann fold n=1 Tax=Propionivibrio dicarboxylicus TaxID=83767 RepID=A0A1G8JBW4_9RHOO|nr:Gfo/Idh/MocA family oxidoreductase [Propionivibrio dicarboxylicus]SDI28735.1 Oxidoreductase family, NAD-binding Rossmann fold [Propionivibrio dicarboxylicus]